MRDHRFPLSSVSCGDLSIPVPGYLVVVDMGELEVLRLPWPYCCDGCQVPSLSPVSHFELHISSSVIFVVSFLPLLPRLYVSFSGVVVVISLRFFWEPFAVSFPHPYSTSACCFFPSVSAARISSFRCWLNLLGHLSLLHGGPPLLHISLGHLWVLIIWLSTFVSSFILVLLMMWTSGYLE